MASIAELMMVGNGLTGLRTQQQNQENRIVRVEDNYHSVLKAMGELGGDIKELLRAKTSSDKFTEMLEVKIEAIGPKFDKVATTLGSKIDDFGNVVGDLGSRILKLEWQVGVILAITGVFLTGMLVPTVINWLKEKVFQTSTVNLAQPTQSPIALAPTTIVNRRRRYSAET